MDKVLSNINGMFSLFNLLEYLPIITLIFTQCYKRDIYYIFKQNGKRIASTVDLYFIVFLIVYLKNDFKNILKLQTRPNCIYNFLSIWLLRSKQHNYKWNVIVIGVRKK